MTARFELAIIGSGLLFLTWFVAGVLGL